MDTGAKQLTAVMTMDVPTADRMLHAACPRAVMPRALSAQRRSLEPAAVEGRPPSTPINPPRWMGCLLSIGCSFSGGKRICSSHSLFMSNVPRNGFYHTRTKGDTGAGHVMQTRRVNGAGGTNHTEMTLVAMPRSLLEARDNSTEPRATGGATMVRWGLLKVLVAVLLVLLPRVATTLK